MCQLRQFEHHTVVRWHDQAYVVVADDPVYRSLEHFVLDERQTRHVSAVNEATVIIDRGCSDQREMSGVANRSMDLEPDLGPAWKDEHVALAHRDEPRMSATIRL